MTDRSEAHAWSAHLDDARCADLVLGLLDVSTRADALAHAMTCTECEVRLRAHAGAAARAQADHLTLVATLPVRARRVAWLPVAGGLAIAAALAAVFALPLLRSPASLPAHANFSLPLPGDEVLSRESGATDAHLTAGLAAVRAHDLATARRELAAANTRGPAELVRRLYLAQVLDASGDPARALSQLSALRFGDLPEPWRTDGARLYARLLRRTGHTDMADSVEGSLPSGAEPPRVP